jgi:hypothetical protein
LYLFFSVPLLHYRILQIMDLMNLINSWINNIIYQKTLVISYWPLSNFSLISHLGYLIRSDCFFPCLNIFCTIVKCLPNCVLLIQLFSIFPCYSLGFIFVSSPLYY